jgi:copper chaperone CopZ
MIPSRTLLVPAAAVAAAVASCAQHAAPTTATLRVGGMTCSSCEQTICSRLKELPGVQACAADFQQGSVTVTFDGARTKQDEIAAAIRAAGYEVP